MDASCPELTHYRPYYDFVTTVKLSMAVKSVGMKLYTSTCLRSQTCRKITTVA